MEEKLYTSLMEIIQHPEKKQRLMDLITQKISAMTYCCHSVVVIIFLICLVRKSYKGGLYDERRAGYK